MMMRKILTLILAPILAAALSGCITVNVTESKVFLPLKRVQGQGANTMIGGDMSVLPAHIRQAHSAIPSAIGEIGISRLSLPENASKPLVLSCMGTSADRFRSGRYYTRKAINHADVMLFEYPGYNGNAGAPTTTDFVHAADAVAAHLRAEKARTGRTLIAWGHSLGGFVCADIVKRAPNIFDGVIIETSAQNIKQVVKARTPALIGPILKPKIQESLRAFDVAAALSDFKGPILVLGAAQDEILKPQLSRKLAAALEGQNPKVTYVEFDPAGHETVYKSSEFPGVMDRYFGQFYRSGPLY